MVSMRPVGDPLWMAPLRQQELSPVVSDMATVVFRLREFDIDDPQL